MENGPKITGVEAFLLLVFVGFLDLIGVLLLLIGLDDFFLLDSGTAATQFYLRRKGVKATYDLAMGLVEMIPYVGALPLKTIGVIMVIWADWRGSESRAESAAEELQYITKPETALTSFEYTPRGSGKIDNSKKAA
mgnify:CR=1 FL=1